MAFNPFATVKKGFSTSDLLLVSSNKRTQGGVVENGAGSMNTKRAKSSTTKLMDSLLKPKLISTSTRADMQVFPRKKEEKGQNSLILNKTN